MRQCFVAAVAAFGSRNIYGGWVSTRVLLIVSALLIVAGTVAIAAAVMGNPIRIGRTRFPGPETSAERAVIGVMGAVCLAAIIPAFLVGAAHDGNVRATVPVSVDASSSPELVVTTTDPPAPTATATAEPPAGPSTSPVVPGKPTVTAVAVAGGPVSNRCTRTFTGTVHVSNGPADVRYRIYVDGVVTGANNRTRTVNGDGAKSLDSITVTAAHSGAVKVRYDVLGPNPALLTATTTWTADAACQPAGPTAPGSPTTTAPPPPPTPTVTVSGFGVTGPNDTDDCATASLHLSASLLVTSAPAGGLAVSYQFSVDGNPVGPSSATVDTSTPISATFSPVTSGQSLHVALTVSSSAQATIGAQPAPVDFTVTCTAAG